MLASSRLFNRIFDPVANSVPIAADPFIGLWFVGYASALNLNAKDAIVRMRQDEIALAVNLRSCGRLTEPRSGIEDRPLVSERYGKRIVDANLCGAAGVVPD